MSSDPDELSSLVTECDKEPIHLLGKIQNHGFMVILNSAGVVTYLSKNASHYLNDSATHEMITNAAKYGALSATNNDGCVSITWELDDKGCTISWKERGGPPLQWLGDDSFGMTVIRSVIPHELNGQAELKPEITGLTAEFVIPRQYIEIGAASDPKQTLSNKRILQEGSTVKENVPLTTAYIVEDNLLISLDIKKHLQQLGIEGIEIFGYEVEIYVQDINEHHISTGIYSLFCKNEKQSYFCHI